MSRRLRALRAVIRLATRGPRVRAWGTWDYDGPYVCPGCHAVAPDRCLPGCIDDEIASEREDEADRHLDDLRAMGCTSCGAIEESLSDRGYCNECVSDSGGEP